MLSCSQIVISTWLQSPRSHILTANSSTPLITYSFRQVSASIPSLPQQGHSSLSHTSTFHQIAPSLKVGFCKPDFSFSLHRSLSRCPSRFASHLASTTFLVCQIETDLRLTTRRSSVNLNIMASHWAMLLFALFAAIQDIYAMPSPATWANSSVHIEARTRKMSGVCGGIVPATRDNWIAYDTPSWIRKQLEAFRESNGPSCSDDSCPSNKSNFVDYLVEKYAPATASSAMNCIVQQMCTVRPILPHAFTYLSNANNMLSDW